MGLPSGGLLTGGLYFTARRSVRRWGPAVLCAALLTLAHPPFAHDWLAWIALVPLLAVIRQASAGTAFAISYLAGALFFLGCFAWILTVGAVRWVDYLLLGIYLGSFVGLFGLAYRWLLHTRWVSPVVWAPALWVCIEFAWTNIPILALPLAGLSYSQYLNSTLIQISSVTGHYGVSFLIVMVNTALAELLARRRLAVRSALLALVTLSAALIYGHAALEDVATDRVKVTVIQGNVSQQTKWRHDLLLQHLEKHIRLTRQAQREQRAALIVWPESSIPLAHSPALMRRVSALAKELDTHLLTGSAQQPKAGRPKLVRQSDNVYRLNLYNNAYLISPSGKIVQTYAKRRLVPFSEYLPAPWLPWPDRWRDGASTFIAGAEATVFELPAARFGAAICWESSFPELVRETARSGAQFLVNIGNEAWFDRSAAADQILAANVFRAVENGVAIARAVNTGISGFIDPQGRIMQVVAKGGERLFVDGFSTAALPLSQQPTFYSLFGDLFAYANLAGATLLIAALFWVRRLVSAEGPRRP